MKVEVENLNGHYKKVSIEVPSEVVDTRITDHLKSIQREVALKGFRKGKVPLEMVRDLYAEGEASRITQKIVEETLREALSSNELSPVAPPDLEVSVVKSGNPFKFSATFEHLPPLELKTYTGFQANKPSFEASDAEVDEALKNIQQQMTRLQKKEEEDVALAEGLVAQVDFEATEAGQKVEEASPKGAFIEPGAGHFIEEVEKQIIGIKAGEARDFSVKFPDKSPDGQPHPFAGRTLDFAVQCLGMFVKEVPELNDDFAPKAGPFKTLAELKDRLRIEVARQKEEQWKKDTQEKILAWLIENNPLEAPETLVNQQIQNLAIEAGMQLQQRGLDQNAIEERLKEWGEEMAQRGVSQVKASLILGAVARQEQIQVDDEDIRKEISRMATQTRRDPQDIVKNLQEKNLIPGFMRQVQEFKALDWILEKSS